MSIVDYTERSRQLREAAKNNPEISQVNKDALERFLNAYDVSPARETIFIQHIVRFLRLTPDINKAMQERETINLMFKKIKEEYSPATLDTCKNVAARFCRWLNNGEKPCGFKDVVRDKNSQKRNLKPEDMITWEDAQKIVAQTNSLQIKAAFLTQLDCGFRPSEFTDLNYGDVKILNDLIIFQVNEGKTGSRQVWMQRAVPAFLRWYDNHPTKKKTDPLWVMENIKQSHRKGLEAIKYERYAYKSLQKRFNLLFEKANIDKPSDFYNIRHSSCVLDKLDNVPSDLASERHGHSVEFYTNTYGRLDIQDKINRVRQHYGKPEEKRTLLRNMACSRCKSVNEPEAEFCRDCGAPLSAATAAKIFEEKRNMQEELASMNKKFALMEKLMRKRFDELKSDPRIISAAKKEKISQSSK